jgi:hypothetical protein
MRGCVGQVLREKLDKAAAAARARVEKLKVTRRTRTRTRTVAQTAGPGR